MNPPHLIYVVLLRKVGIMGRSDVQPVAAFPSREAADLEVTKLRKWWAESREDGDATDLDYWTETTVLRS